MTVSYSHEVASAKFGGFIRLLRRWHGSIYKFIWKDFAVYAILHYSISFAYYFLMDDSWKGYFEDIAKFCDKASDRIPVAFILGFYVSLVVGRFWEQLNALPWPSRMAVFVSTMIRGGDYRGRVVRRTVIRYLTLAYILTMRDICPPVRKRFKTFKDIGKAGLLTEEEWKILEEISKPNRTKKIDLHNLDDLGSLAYAPTVHEAEAEASCPCIGDKKQDELTPNVFYVPLLWAADLVNKEFDDERVKEFAVKILIEELNNYRGQCGTMITFDWITVPLVYTQVVTIAVYTFFLTCLLGRQHLENHEGDFYLPVFTFLEFLFIVGWLKVAENLLNPFGGDDDDFEINPLIEDNLQVAFTMVDELYGFSPQLEEDRFFKTVDVDIPYTVSAEKYRARRLVGSAAKVLDKCTIHCISRTEDSGDDQEKLLIYRTADRPGDADTLGDRQPLLGVLPSSDTEMTSFSASDPLLPADGCQTQANIDEPVSRHQQPMDVRQGDADTMSDLQATVSLSPAFMEDIRQALFELRLGPQAASSYRRSKFL